MMKMVHWWVLLGLFTFVATGFPFSTQEDHEDSGKEQDEGSHLVMPSSVPRPPKIHICGYRILAEISTICGHTHRPNGKPQRDLLPRRSIRSVVDDCCRTGCNLSELQRYCANPAFGVEHAPRTLSLQEFIQEFADILEEATGGDPTFESAPVEGSPRGVKAVYFQDLAEVGDESGQPSRLGEKTLRTHKKGMSSDELSHELDEGSTVSIGHMVSADYKSSDSLFSGMEKLAAAKGGIAVIIPARRI